MKLDLTPLEDAVAQLEEGLDIYHSDLALTDPRLKKHLRATSRDLSPAIGVAVLRITVRQATSQRQFCLPYTLVE